MCISAVAIVETDNICDYIPIVSTITSLIDLFMKCIYGSFTTETCGASLARAHFLEKDLCRIIALLFIPVLGSIYIFFNDWAEYEGKKDAAPEIARWQKETREMLAEAAKMYDDVTELPHNDALAVELDDLIGNGAELLEPSTAPRSGMEIIFGRITPPAA